MADGSGGWGYPFVQLRATIVAVGFGRATIVAIRFILFLCELLRGDVFPKTTNYE